MATGWLFCKWRGKRVFCNPPYGRQIGDWIQRGAEAEVAVFLLPENGYEVVSRACFSARRGDSFSERSAEIRPRSERRAVSQHRRCFEKRQPATVIAISDPLR